MLWRHRIRLMEEPEVEDTNKHIVSIIHQLPTSHPACSSPTFNHKWSRRECWCIKKEPADQRFFTLTHCEDGKMKKMIILWCTLYIWWRMQNISSIFHMLVVIHPLPQCPFVSGTVMTHYGDLGFCSGFTKTPRRHWCSQASYSRLQKESRHVWDLRSPYITVDFTNAQSIDLMTPCRQRQILSHCRRVK